MARCITKLSFPEYLAQYGEINGTLAGKLEENVAGDRITFAISTTHDISGDQRVLIRLFPKSGIMVEGYVFTDTPEEEQKLLDLVSGKGQVTIRVYDAEGEAMIDVS